MPRFLCGLTVAVFVLFGSATQACTPPDYVAPSNFELVQIVEAIVVGTPVDMIIEGDGPRTHVAFTVDDVLKGPLMRGDTVELSGLSIDEQAAAE